MIFVAVVANYTYDAWGRLLSVKNASGSTISDASHIANVNPIRYRGYFYDAETKLYYCNSRYYDPQIKRFINADELLSTGTGFLGYNMFAYCENNPVMYSDPSGYYDIREIGYGGFGGFGDIGGGGGGGGVSRGIGEALRDVVLVGVTAAVVAGCQTDSLREEKFKMFHAGLLVTTISVMTMVDSSEDVIDDVVAQKRKKLLQYLKTTLRVNTMEWMHGVTDLFMSPNQ